MAAHECYGSAEHGKLGSGRYGLDPPQTLREQFHPQLKSGVRRLHSLQRCGRVVEQALNGGVDWKEWVLVERAGQPIVSILTDGQVDHNKTIRSLGKKSMGIVSNDKSSD